MRHLKSMTEDNSTLHEEITAFQSGNAKTCLRGECGEFLNSEMTDKIESVTRKFSHKNGSAID